MYETWFSMAGVAFVLYLFVIGDAPKHIDFLAVFIVAMFFILGVLDLYGVITPSK